MILLDSTPSEPVFPQLAIVLIVAVIGFGLTFLILKNKSKYNLIRMLLISALMAGSVVIIIITIDLTVSGRVKLFTTTPYEFTEFKSLEFRFGVRDSLVNKYNSATGDYQYLNNRDSLVKTKLYLTTSELLYLHHKAADLGFWDFPAKELNSDTARINGVKPLRYIIRLNYNDKSKEVVFDANYTGPQKLADANAQMVNEIERVLNEAETREKK